MRAPRYEAELLASLAECPITSLTLTGQHLSNVPSPPSDLLAPLKASKTLRELQLHLFTNLSPANLQPLLEVERLESLSVIGHSDAQGIATFDDSAVAVLSQFKRLKQLTLRHVALSDEGVKKVRAALPNCQVSVE